MGRPIDFTNNSLEGWAQVLIQMLYTAVEVRWSAVVIEDIALFEITYKLELR